MKSKKPNSKSTSSTNGSTSKKKGSKEWVYDSDVDEDEDDDKEEEEEWDAGQETTHSSQIDPEKIYAKDIRQYDSSASDNDYEYDDEYDSHEDGFEVDVVEDDSEDEFECWKSKQQSNRRKQKKKQKDKFQNSKNSKSNSKIGRKRVQKLRCRRRFKSMKPLPMPENEQKVHILNNDITKSPDFTSTLGFSSVRIDDDDSDTNDNRTKTNGNAKTEKPPPSSTSNEPEQAEDAEVHLCKIVQCTLWDCNFRFQLLPHQFVATLSVAGIDVPKVLNQLMDIQTQFPVDYQNFINVLDEKKGKSARKFFCIHTISFLETRGCLLADVMGLGKTISSIAGAILRNYIIKVKSKFEKKTTVYIPKLPTLIVGPNDAVLDQWEETLILSGVEFNRIKQYTYYDDTILAHVDNFILMTRYTMMSEMRNLFETEATNLLPTISTKLLRDLNHVFDQNRGKKITGKNKNRKVRHKGESVPGCIRRLVMKTKSKPLFRTFILDEAHFLKNLCSFWGMCAACLGVVSERSVPLTGTPYNNGNQDMATLMTFIDPTLPSADIKWWEKATEKKNFQNVIQNVQQWRHKYVIRREKSVLADQLTKKFVTIQQIGVTFAELVTYHYYEHVFQKVMKQFKNLSERAENLLTQHRRKEVFAIIMACMACMRMALIHPMIPKGRELTMKFSPSRRNSAQVRAKICNDLQQECVVCEHFPSQPPLSDEAMKEMEGANTKKWGDNLDEIDDADFERTKKKKYKIDSPLIEVPDHMCSCQSTGFQHYVHEECLEKLEKMTGSCPRCDDLKCRLDYNSKSSSSLPIYCQEVSAVPGTEGFQSTSKMEEIIKWVDNIVDEKVILYSFFKSTLDLFEGVLVDHLGMECARFDGDVEPEDRATELRRFKESSTCNVLLATVQSSGTGLNIVEANHVGFIDRWFNPCVHAQAEDRCHRLKQTRDVHVKYFDVSMSIDQIMKVLNDKKNMNGSILLADGSSIGAQQGGVGYQELSGTIGLLVTEMIGMRTKFFQDNPEGTLKALTDEEIEDMINNPSKAKKSEIDSKELFSRNYVNPEAKAKAKQSAKVEMQDVSQSQDSQPVKSIAISKRESKGIAMLPPQELNEANMKSQKNNDDISSPCLVKSDHSSSLYTASKGNKHQQGAENVGDNLGEEQQSSSKKRSKHPHSQHSPPSKRTKTNEVKFNASTNLPLHQASLSVSSSSSIRTENVIGATSNINNKSTKDSSVDKQNDDDNTPPLHDSDTAVNDIQGRTCSPPMKNDDMDSSDDEILSPGPFHTSRKPPLHKKTSSINRFSPDRSNNVMVKTAKIDSKSLEEISVNEQSHDNNTPPLYDSDSHDNHIQGHVCSTIMKDDDLDSSDDDIPSPGPFRSTR